MHPPPSCLSCPLGPCPARSWAELRGLLERLSYAVFHCCDPYPYCLELHRRSLGCEAGVWRELHELELRSPETHRPNRSRDQRPPVEAQLRGDRLTDAVFCPAPMLRSTRPRRSVPRCCRSTAAASCSDMISPASIKTSPSSFRRCDIITRLPTPPLTQFRHRIVRPSGAPWGATDEHLPESDD